MSLVSTLRNTVNHLKENWKNKKDLKYKIIFKYYKFFTIFISSNYEVFNYENTD
jgi:hypothetical protein